MIKLINMTCVMCVVLISICSQCELAADFRSEIKLVNQSGYPIGYYFAHGGEFGTYYPDSLPLTNNYIAYDMSKELRPGMEIHYSWDKFFEALPYDTLSVFIFHTDTLNKYTWEEVRDGYKILRRYDLSQEDLQGMNWTITYP